MRFVSFRHDGRESFGYLDGPETIVDLGRDGMTLAVALERHPYPAEMATLGGPRVATERIEWLPPVPAPRKILCVGFNFRRHSAEADADRSDEPTLFARFADSLVGHEQAVLAPTTVSTELDWEGELAVVIGRRAWRVSPGTALEFVAGYMCMAENSVRDWQAHGTQATAGKNFWRSGAVGPALVTADEVGDPAALDLETRLNGNVVQHAGLAEMVFSVNEILAYITTFTPLHAGDVIAMGTPSGVGFRQRPPRFLGPGDTLEVEIGDLGILRNPVAALDVEQAS